MRIRSLVIAFGASIWLGAVATAEVSPTRPEIPDKTFSITERLRFTFRAEAFNVWNHPSFAAPSGNIEAATFGNITATTVGARVLQFGGKLSF